MDSSDNPKPDLSLVSLFDDMCRFSDHLIGSSTHEQNSIRGLVRNFDKNRDEWLYDHKEANRLTAENSWLKSRISQLTDLLGNALTKNTELEKQTKHLRDLLENCQKAMKKSPKFSLIDWNESNVIDLSESEQGDSNSISKSSDGQQSDGSSMSEEHPIDENWLSYLMADIELDN